MPQLNSTLYKCAVDFVGDGFAVLMTTVKREIANNSVVVEELHKDMFMQLAAFGFRFQHAAEAQRVAASVAARAAAGARRVGRPRRRTSVDWVARPRAAASGQPLPPLHDFEIKPMAPVMDKWTFNHVHELCDTAVEKKNWQRLGTAVDLLCAMLMVRLCAARAAARGEGAA